MTATRPLIWIALLGVIIPCFDRTASAAESSHLNVKRAVLSRSAVAAGGSATVRTASAAESSHLNVKRAVLSRSAVAAGSSATVAVVLSIDKGYHSQSHEPLDKYLVPLVVKIKPVEGVATAGAPIYPKGEIKNYPNLGKLSVYDGEVVVFIPVDVAAGASPQTALVKGSVSYQVCNDQICLPPGNAPFEVKLPVVAKDTATTPTDDPAFAKLPTSASSQPAATQPATRKGDLGASPPAPPSGDSGSRSGGNPAEAQAASSSNLNDLSEKSLAWVFTVAFLVGIVFNIVPCVLPVLPLKAMGFYETAQHDRVRSFTFGMAFSAGVVFSFAILGFLVLGLKVVTWGEIFSNPWFDAAIVLILVVMAFNMFGLFTVNVPTRLYAFSPRHDTYFGNFLFGILTAALSTPCTFGLFVSVLVAASKQSPVVGLLIVTVVGVGMASPYLLLSALPELARKFPRTGPWPEVVKQIMGFLLLAVAIFFAKNWVAKAVGQHAVWWLIFACLAGASVFLVERAFKLRRSMVAPIVACVIAVVVIVPSALAARQLAVERYVWQTYTPAELATSLDSHDIVLVDFTASWCTTCHWLEATVLNTDATVRLVDRNEVRMVRADLSETDAPGWTLLRRLNAPGVPLTVVYSKNLRQPIRLAGLYSFDDLKAAIERAGRSETAAR